MFLRLLKKLVNVIINIFGSCPKPKQAVRFDVKFGLPQPKKTQMIETTITNEQKITAALKPVTATGKPAVLDGKPTWTVQSGDSTIVVSEDGLSAELVSSDTPGDTMYLVEADADLGEGVETVSDVIKLTVAGARAANLGLSLGDPVPKA